MSKYFNFYIFNEILYILLSFVRKLLDQYYALLEKTGEDFWWIHDVQKLVSNTSHSPEKLKKGLVCSYLLIILNIIYIFYYFYLTGYSRYLVR